MNKLPRGAWHYGVLLILLFSIAAIAARHTIGYLEDCFDAAEYEEARQGTTFAIWALTMGFMLLSAAFGLWAVRFSAEAESLRRIGLFVEEMSYLRDGLVSLDGKGKIGASNPSFKAIAPGSAKHGHVRNLFPCLSEDQLALLLRAAAPVEVEVDMDAAGQKRTYRFRSQPSSDLKLVLISDITVRKSEELRRRQVANLQLIGRIARGIAHDFNNVLCSISGHASLVPRLKPGSPEAAEAIEAIIRDSGKGAELASHLVQLSQSDTSVTAATQLPEHMEKAAELLRMGLAAEWQVRLHVQDSLPSVPLPGIQVEQVVLNLGLLTADAASRPATVYITAASPADKPLVDVGDRYGAVILVSAAEPPHSADAHWGAGVSFQSVEDAGVIASVVRTVVEEAEGAFDIVRAGNGALYYRVALPRAPHPATTPAIEAIPPELCAYVQSWRILLVRSKRHPDELDDSLRRIELSVDKVDSVALAFSHLDKGPLPDAMVWDRRLLGAEPASLLRTLVRLCPGSGIVVIQEEPAGRIEDLPRNVVVLQPAPAPSRVLHALIEAKTGAVKTTAPGGRYRSNASDRS